MTDIFSAQQDWQAKRLGKFTASNIGKLLKKGRSKAEYFGDGALTYINAVLTEILTSEPMDGELSGANIKSLQHGQAHEYEALILLQERTGIEIEFFGLANPQFIEYNRYSGGTPDGLSAEYLIEIKCPWNSAIHTKRLKAVLKGLDFNQWLKEEEPDYYAQVQFNMMCAKKDKALFVSYDPRAIAYGDNRLVIMEILADKEYQTDLSERLEKAAEIISEDLALIRPVIIAERDEQVNATIVQRA